MKFKLIEKITYHYGDLDVARKADRRAIMGGRGTGHFGTGFYMVSFSDPSKASGYKKIKEKESESLNEVYPNKGESKKDFISRFMSVTKDEYPDQKQRFAIANSYWERRNK